MRRAFTLVSLLSILPACIVEAPTSEKSGAAAQSSRGQVKPVPVKNGAVLGDLAELVGATFAPPSLTPGDGTRVVLVFRAIKPCLLYTSDAADERSSVDLGGRRI